MIEGDKNKMSVKLMLLKTGETIITDAKEVLSGEITRGYLLSNPHFVNTKEKTLLVEGESGKSNYEIDVILSPWLILSKDKEFIVNLDYVATICDPIESVKQMYLDKTENSLQVIESEEDLNE